MENQTSSNKFLIPISIVIAGALVAGAIYFGGSTSSPQAAQNNTNASKIEIKPVSETDHIRGSRSAELTIVEYSDTECPFCKTFHNTMKEVLDTYGTQVAWVYRQFPIPQLHSRAMKEAEATECVAELGGNLAFWNYLDKIFETTNSNDSLDPAELPRLAASVDISEVRFNECLNSGKYTEVVKKSIEDAYKAGARGTPYSVILDRDGKVKDTINGAEPFERVKVKLDALLK